MKSLLLILALAVLLLACGGSAGQAGPLPSLTPDETPPASPSPSPSPSPSVSATIEPSFSPTPVPSRTPLPPSATPSPTPTPLPLVFAVIGDYGLAGPDAQAVADLVKSWSPELIITTGDNNYPVGAPETLDANIGQYYSEYIFPYRGQYGPGAEVNRFFPAPGNHDFDSDGGQGYFDYFELPGNERYYDFVWGPVHFLALNSDYREPDGVAASSQQAAWLQEQLAASLSAWKVVYMHVPPYSSGVHGSTDWMRWPYREWGATVAISGHNHLYERLEVGGFPYIVNGLGGNGRYSFQEALPESLVRFNQDFGAMRVTASQQQLILEFISVDGLVVDRLVLTNE